MSETFTAEDVADSPNNSSMGNGTTINEDSGNGSHGDATTSDTINAAESLLSLHHIISPDKNPSTKKRKDDSMDKPLKPITMEQLETYFIITLWSCYHQKSIFHMRNNMDIYPHINMLFKKMGGSLGFSKVSTSFKVIKESTAATWKGHYDEVAHIKEMQDMISRVNAEVTFPEGLRDSTIDDDKMKNRSKDWDTLGYPRKKGSKSYGPVLNLCCQSPTGLFVSCGVTKFSENATDSAKVLLQRATATTNQLKMDMNGAWLNVDRGYNDAEFLDYTASINLNVFLQRKEDQIYHGNLGK